MGCVRSSDLEIKIPSCILPPRMLSKEMYDKMGMSLFDYTWLKTKDGL